MKQDTMSPSTLLYTIRDHKPSSCVVTLHMKHSRRSAIRGRGACVVYQWSWHITVSHCSFALYHRNSVFMWCFWWTQWNRIHLLRILDFFSSRSSTEASEVCAPDPTLNCQMQLNLRPKRCACSVSDDQCTKSTANYIKHTLCKLT